MNQQRVTTHCGKRSNLVIRFWWISPSWAQTSLKLPSRTSNLSSRRMLLAWTSLKKEYSSYKLDHFGERCSAHFHRIGISNIHTHQQIKLAKFLRIGSSAIHIHQQISITVTKKIILLRKGSLGNCISSLAHFPFLLV